MTVGDRVRWKAQYDPLASFAIRHGLTSPAGTIDSIEDGVAFVIWDSEAGEAQGSMSPHQLEELEATP